MVLEVLEVVLKVLEVFLEVSYIGPAENRPPEKVGDTPTINFHNVSSKSDFREPSFEHV